jgi:N-acyl-D-amino-acid deacylase
MPRLALVLLVLLCARAAGAEVYDLVIEHGHIVDGTGSPWYAGDVAIKNHRIAAIGELSHARAKRRIDATGLVVAPGFIDMLGQSELTVLVDPHLPSKIFQGITTEVTGEGESIAPLNDSIRAHKQLEFAHYRLTPDWSSLADYFARLEQQGSAINLASYVGATTLRELVIGYEERKATPEELERMRAIAAQAMREGAVGVSTSLEYAPAPYADTEELIALAREAGRYGGIYATHMRSEQSEIFEAIDETIRIAREAQLPVEIWHLKVSGRPQWGRMNEVVAKIEAARASGVDLAADTYAYTAWGNDMSAFVPPWAHAGGDAKLLERLKDPATRARVRAQMEQEPTGWENEWAAIEGPEKILITDVKHAALQGLLGKSIAEIAHSRGREPIETLLDILIEDEAATGVAVFGMSEPDVALALKQPWVSVCNDSQGTSPEGLLGEEHPHPRAYGTFPRILRKYVREEHLLTLEDAIRKFTALPAARMHFDDRGVLKTSLMADIVVFDPVTITDRASYESPNQLSVGMRYVLVNGIAVVDEGVETSALPGRVLRGRGYRR